MDSVSFPTKKLKQHLAALSESVSPSNFYEFVRFCKFSGTDLTSLLDAEQFVSLLGNADFVRLLIMNMAVWPEEIATNDAPQENQVYFDLKKLALESLEFQRERSAIIRKKLSDNEPVHELFEALRPFSSILNQFSANSADEIVKDIHLFVAGKQHWHDAGVFRISEDEGRILSELVSRSQGISAHAVQQAVFPPDGEVRTDLLETLLEHAPQLVDAVIGRGVIYRWDFSQEFLISVLSAPIHGVPDDPVLTSLLHRSVPGWQGCTPKLIVSPDSWLTFIASSDDYIERWDESPVFEALKSRIAEVIAHILESLCSVLSPNLVSDISGATFPYLLYDDYDECSFHPVAMILSRFHDESGPYDAWDRSDRELSPVAPERRHPAYLALVDAFCDWHLWIMADHTLAFFMLSDYVARESLDVSRRDFSLRYERLAKAGFGQASREVVLSLCKMGGNQLGSFAAYKKVIELMAVGRNEGPELDPHSINATRNLSRIDSLKYLCNRSNSLLFEAERRWCEESHKIGVENKDWGDVILNYFRAIECELQLRFNIVSHDLLRLDSSAMQSWDKPTGGQINNALKNAASGQYSETFSAVLSSVIPFQMDEHLWKEMVELWKLRNKAAHGGGRGFVEKDVTKLRGMLFGKGILERFSYVFR